MDEPRAEDVAAWHARHDRIRRMCEAIVAAAAVGDMDPLTVETARKYLRQNTPRTGHPISGRRDLGRDDAGSVGTECARRPLSLSTATRRHA